MATHSTALLTHGGEPVVLGHVSVDPLTEGEVVDYVSAMLAAGVGGTICTPNLDIWLRTRDDESARELLRLSELVVADGMPLVWAARLQGTPLPERVTGSSLVDALAAAAARGGWRVHIVGGGPDGTAERAAGALRSRYPELDVVGAVTPPFGFETEPAQLAALVDSVIAAEADLVLVGLGFPKQEQLALVLRQRMPRTWFLGCGAGVQMAAGMVVRSPKWLQAGGGEWLFRLLQEPRRLARRYLIDDLPAAVALFTTALAARARRR